MKRIIVLSSLFLLCISFKAQAQKYSEFTLRKVLDSLSQKHPGLNNSLQLNVSGLQLSELVSSVALENNLNISVDPALNQLISYNFFDAQVKDMLVFLYLNFDLEYDFVGSIISVKKRIKQEPKPIAAPPKKIDVKYNASNNFLSIDLKNDTLWKVTEELTKVSGKNFVVTPEVRNNIVNAYLLNRPFDQVMEMFVKSNGLDLETGNDFFTIGKGEAQGASGGGSTGRGSNYKSNTKTGDFILTKNPTGTIDVFARNIELAELIQAAAEETQIHYILYSDIKGKANLEVKDVRFEELITKLFKGTDFSIKKDDNIYIIGENKLEGFRKTELIRLENRTIESVKAAIPKDMMAGIEVNEFVELNGLILTGSPAKIDELKSFISTIDVVVPMVQIDVMFLFSSKKNVLKAGMRAGLRDNPTQTSGDLFPTVNAELGQQSINNILDAISGFGLVNLGKVTENFYVSIHALEENGIVEIESTPKISTLNGHEANISIGNKTYYQETQVNVSTSVTNQGVLQSKVWKDVSADLSVVIKPFVSADEYVTLTIDVKQNEFTGGDVASGAPPNMSTRTFKSMIRVKNGELILLGGLDRKESNNSGEGVPFLSRIPVLKWLFSERTKIKDKSKLHILIKPTVTY